MSVLRAVLVLAVLAGAAQGAGEAQGGAALRRPALYSLEASVALNDAARRGRDVSYRLAGRLALRAAYSEPRRLLLHYTLLSPELQLKGKHVNADYLPHESIWDSYRDTSFYALWTDGLIETVYLDASEPLDVINYKKAIVSLFQFQVVSGERNETDVSGTCQILYENVSANVVRKIKRRCEWETDAVASTRRVTRYTLGERGDELRALLADELLVLGHKELGLKARALLQLTRLGPPPPPAGPAPAPAPASLDAALAALPAALAPHDLRLPPAAPPPAPELDALLAEHAAALAGAERAGRGGDGALARAALELLPAVRRAPAAALLAALRAAAPAALPALCRVLGLAGAAGAHEAASAFLQLHGAEPASEPARAYLSALALAPAPAGGVLRAALRLGGSARSAPVAAAALLAAGAGAARHAAAGGDDSLARSVRDELVRSLSRCKDEPCRTVRLHALGNMRRADTADVLLEHAEREREPAAALAALDALGAAPLAALTYARLERLSALVLRVRMPPEARAAALELVVRGRAPAPLPLAELGARLLEQGARDLLRLLLQHAAALAPRHAPLRDLLAALPPRLRSWDAAAPGASAAQLREPGWAAGGWTARLSAVQVAPAALLRRAVVRLLAEDDAGNSFDTLSVKVWTRGLEAFGGGAPDEAEGEAEEPSGGLALRVGGARLPDAELFAGRAELLAHVWAGTGSEPTPAARALVPLASREVLGALQAGVRLRGGWRGALALALDAQAHASLWHRTARARLAVRAAAALQAHAQLDTAWARLEAHSEAGAAPRLRIDADLDFYDEVALCVRASADDHAYERTVRLTSSGGARRLRVARTTRSARAGAGRSLSLGRRNDAACRSLRAAPEDDAQ